MSFCSVFNCSNRGSRNEDISFYRLPTILKTKDTEKLKLAKIRRKKWIEAINRTNITKSKLENFRVCSKHFVSGKPSQLADIENVDWVPTRNIGYKKRHGAAPTKLPSPKAAAPVFPQVQEVYHEVELDENMDAESHTPLIAHESTQTDFFDFQQTETKLLIAEARLNAIDLTENSFQGNDQKTKYFTGLPSFALLHTLLTFIRPHLNHHHKCKLPPFQQLLLTLMKLRLNTDFYELAKYRFNIQPSTSSQVFYDTINVLYQQLRGLIKWPTRDVLRKTLPQCFRESIHSKTTIIIDCFEVNIETPSNYLTKAQVWSNYKHHSTAKFLLGITPQGTISYISEAWGGRASDKHITIHCGLLDNLIPGDVILADRGFLIKEYVEMMYADVLVPAFTKGKKQLHPLELEKTRSLANVRIHVERVIGMLRNKFKYFKGPIPISAISAGSLDKIVTVCAALINLCPPVIP